MDCPHRLRPGSIGLRFDGKATWSREKFARTVIHDGLMYAFNMNKLRAVWIANGSGFVDARIWKE